MPTSTAVAIPKSEPPASRPVPTQVPEPRVFGKSKARPLFEGPIVRRAVRDAFTKLNPRHQLRNPVMFVVEVGSALTTVLFVAALAGKLPEPPGFILGVS